MDDSRVTLAGSHRDATGSVTGPVPDEERAQATLVLRRGAEQGADPGDVENVLRACREAGLEVLEDHAASRRVRVEGEVGALSEMFGTRLRRVQRSDGLSQRRMRSGTLSLPVELGDHVVAVLGLDDRPQASVRSVFADPRAAGTSFTPVELADVYGMPASDGSGQTVAIIELGGGFASADLDTYFTGLGLATPTVTAVPVDGATNQPGQDPQGADGEVLLDIEVTGAIAPGAGIVVYFAPNTDAGFVDAVSTAAHATPAPVAISISWGQSEDQWTAQARTAMDDAIADATARGITVTVAAGDNGSADNDTSGPVHVDFPASSPHALGCGGTTLVVSGGRVTSETVWNDGGQGGATGGGVSDAFPLPSWQARAGVPQRAGGGVGRGVPDVAADADPHTGYRIHVDGRDAVIGGTSAVAPLWAGLLARVAQLTGSRPGLVQPRLYAGAQPGAPAPALRDITAGNNGAYAAGPGWDACTGLGVPQPATLQPSESSESSPG